MNNLTKFIKDLPKSELHLHIEGTFEPELMFKMAKKNNIKLKYDNVEDLKNAYNFTDLQSFLDIYYQGMSCLIEEEDFYDLTMAYLTKIHSENVRHVEIFFDPQGHTERGISFKTAITGILKALDEAQDKFGISYRLIMSFLRHLSEEDGFKTLEESLPFKDKIYAVGLDSSEMGHPPSKFTRLFKKASEYGYITVAHAGEEGPPEYVNEALDLLKIIRIDHGNRSLEDPALTQRIIDNKIALTVCPLSNLALKNCDDLKNHPLKKMLELGIIATINSDDPAYFGGYMNANYNAVTEALNLQKSDLIQLAKNGFTASFADDARKTQLLEELNDYTVKTA